MISVWRQDGVIIASNSASVSMKDIFTTEDERDVKCVISFHPPSTVTAESLEGNSGSAWLKNI